MRYAQRLVIGWFRARLNLTAVFSPSLAARHAMEIFSTPFRRQRKEMPGIFWKSEALGFNFDGRHLQAYRWNHPAERKVLILHGYESCAYKFERYVKPLIRKGFTVVAIDAPAHGRSEGRRVTLMDYVRAIEQTEKRYGPFDAYMAHSFGGIAASLFLEGRADKKDARLSLIAPATETSTALAHFYRFLQIGEPVRREFEKIIERRTGHDVAHYSIRRMAGNIRARMLWVHDEDDQVTPISDVRPVMEAGHPHIRFMVTNGLGHRRIYRDDRVARAVVDFLSGDEPGESTEDSDGFA